MKIANWQLVALPLTILVLCHGWLQLPDASAWEETVSDSVSVDSQAKRATVDFNQDVRPILSDHCFACHGPDANKREGGFRLDQEESAFGPADSGDPAIVPGKPNESGLIARIESTDEFEVMPPEEIHKPLNPRQKEVLRQWIAEGAAYATHWSFVAPKKHDQPKVQRSDWVLDPLDAFILQRLESAGLEPNPEASKAELLRRVTFDLTGLPPTPDELHAFENDQTPEAYERVVDRLLDSPHYGEHMARYWLDLVRYGDTHGLHLDNYREMWPYRDWVIEAFNSNKSYDQFILEQLAGDLLPGDDLQHLIASGFNRLNVTTSEGGSIYEEVFARNVIDRTDAFGTIFLGLTTGCSVCHDHKFDPISQRDYYSLSAFFNSLDGRALDGNAKDHPPVVRVPTGETKARLASLEEMRRELEDEMNGRLSTVDESQRRWEQAILSQDGQAVGWKTLAPLTATSSGGTELVIEEEGVVRASGEAPDKETYTIDAKLPEGGPFQLVQLEVLTEDKDSKAGRGSNGNGVLSEFEVLVKSAATGGEYLPVKFVYGEADYEQSNSPKFSIDFAIDGKVEADGGWAIGGHEKNGGRVAWFVASSFLADEGGDASEVDIRVNLKFESQWAGHSFERIRVSVSEDLPKVSPERQLKVGPWSMVGPFEVENAKAGYYRSFASQQRSFAAEEQFEYGGTSFRWQQRDDFVDAGVNELPTIEDRDSVALLHQTIESPSAQEVTLLVGTTDGFQVWLHGKRLTEQQRRGDIEPLRYEVSLPLKAGKNDLYLKVVNHQGDSAFTTAIRSPAAPIPGPIQRILATGVEDRSEFEARALRDYYRRVVCIHPDWLVLRDMAGGLRKQAEDVEKSMPTTLVWREVETPRTAHILVRGAYDQPGEAVERAVPELFPPMAKELPRDRLGLAKWLVADEHPLTSRVVVNRLWQQLFGVGIVETSEDFGAQGRPPSHAKLLDTLAVDFRESGWDIKQFVKRLVMSSTYRRSSRVTPEMLEIDPKNRLLARGPRFRLDAEMIRDAALVSSGLLVETVGGPSVKPPQPKGLWNAVGYSDSNTANFVADTGEKVYRRSLYTFWKRTSAPPQMTTFDAPSRESCTARRERTNTPLQALLLMNEPQFFEAARKLAARADEQAGDSDHAAVTFMFEAVVSRLPTDSELKSIMKLYADLLKEYTARPEWLADLGEESPEKAARTLVASTILNLDDAVTK